MRNILATILTILLLSPAAFGGSCPGDVNGDGFVGFDDLLPVLADWGECAGCPADLDGDGFVGFPDLLAVLADWGCEPADPESVLTGVVINAWTGAPVVGALVSVDGESFVTGDDGVYSAMLDPGGYAVTFSAMHYGTVEESVVLFPDLTVVLNVALTPVAPVVVTIATSGDAEPDGMVEATAQVVVLDGSTVEGFEWMQTGGADAAVGATDDETLLITLPPRADFKAELFHILVEPPIGPDDLPPTIPPHEGEFFGGLQNRFQVVGLNPFSLEEAGLVSFRVDVTTSSGVYCGEGSVHSALPWQPTASLRNVPVGVPVLLQGREQASYAWSLALPGGSSATLTDAGTRNPEFIPDAPGLYRLTVDDLASGSPAVIDVFAGTWRGIVIGEDADGHPVSPESCVSCHSLLSVDQFTPWAKTGHAEIFTTNLNNSPYWGPQCFSCHSVGYDPAVANGGIDDTVDFLDFLGAGLIGNPSPDNWSTMLDEFATTAQLANVQCENCHGPQSAGAGASNPAHTQHDPRVSLSSDVCATCHGEPLRHARFQQWQLSGHANYELAIDEGESGSCSRCHTANGFLAWLPVLLGDVPGDPTGSIDVTWGIDDVHPQTCVTCHDPHNPGSTSGIDTDATVRVSGNTPELIAGFTAYGVGRGAICMTCHNSRRGLRNDETFAEHFGTSEATRAPHGSAQTDMVMGENAYLVPTGFRGPHSFVTDTCVACHMEATPPPDVLAYNEGGTNHTFFASPDICASCHDEGVTAEFIQDGVQSTLDVLQSVIEVAMLDLIAEQIAAGNFIDLNGAGVITDVALVSDLEFGGTRGRQAITVTFTDDTTLGPFRVTDVDVVETASSTVIGILYDFADAELIKAGWNWGLVNSDGSLGVHNPSFAYASLVSAIEALAPGAAPLAPPWVQTTWSPTVGPRP
ncbi:MAG: hypothetical protein HKO59_10145 [Phycisphaerales bacterium]|nr:carboxypeptidase regulatory-like domain-containing protein [Phycisphaerae bacterium]NNM26325.1 hypothetical protein [Phycisphaerales bacterium]